MDNDWQGVAQAELNRAAQARRWLRIILPVVAAAFMAVMCAGPLAVPATMMWFEGLACPAGQHLEVLEVLDIEVDPPETRQVVYCVDAEGQGTLAGARPFAVMWTAYFAIFVVLTFTLVAVVGRAWQWFFGLPKRRLDWETEREARALLAAGKRDEAVRLLRDRTGAGPRWAQQYVDVIARRSGPPKSA
jgi:TRAP-type C4-dicarboxylate transport system permease small subunit